MRIPGRLPERQRPDGSAVARYPVRSGRSIGVVLIFGGIAAMAVGVLLAFLLVWSPVSFAPATGLAGQLWAKAVAVGLPWFVAVILTTLGAGLSRGGVVLYSTSLEIRLENWLRCRVPLETVARAQLVRPSLGHMLFLACPCGGRLAVVTDQAPALLLLLRQPARARMLGVQFRVSTVLLSLERAEDFLARVRDAAGRAGLRA